MTRAIVLVSLVLAASACKKASKESVPAPKSSGTSAAAAVRIAIDVTKDGFRPEHVNVPQGTPVTLVFDRKTDETCVKQVVLDVDGKKIQKDLPLNTPVEVALTFAKPGELTYVCGMDMVHGTITVQ